MEIRRHEPGRVQYVRCYHDRDCDRVYAEPLCAGEGGKMVEKQRLLSDLQPDTRSDHNDLSEYRTAMESDPFCRGSFCRRPVSHSCL